MTDREKMARELVKAFNPDMDGTSANTEALVVAAYNRGRADMREEACGRIERLIVEGYPLPSRATDQCEHGRYGSQDCIACYDEALTAKLAAIRAIPVGEG